MVNKDTIIKRNDEILRISMYNAFDGKCFYTGRNITFKEMHIDHILPKAMGGIDSIANYVVSCSYINLKKNRQYSAKFIQLTKELINLLFVEKVVSEYNNISTNNLITKGYVEINIFLKSKNFYNHSKSNSFKCMALKKYTHIDIHKKSAIGGISTRKRIYYKEQELETFFNNYDWNKKNKTK